MIEDAPFPPSIKTIDDLNLDQIYRYFRSYSEKLEYPIEQLITSVVIESPRKKIDILVNSTGAKIIDTNFSYSMRAVRYHMHMLADDLSRLLEKTHMDVDHPFLYDYRKELNI